MYADDVLNLSRTFSDCESTFSKLEQEYQQIGLSSKFDKTVAVGSNLKGCSHKSLKLAETSSPL